MALVDSTQEVPTFKTTDTFQQLVDKLNFGLDLQDSDLRYLDARIGDLTELTTTQENLVRAINELDSDLFGTGGGSAATELIGQEKTIIGAINRINTQFDPDFNGSQGVPDSDFVVRANGDASLLLLSDSDIKIRAGLGNDSNQGDVYISTQNRIYFQRDDVDRLTYTFNDSGNVLTSVGLYTVDAQDSVVFRSGANAFSMNNVIDFTLDSGEVQSTVHGDLQHNIDGDYHINLIENKQVNFVRIENHSGHIFEIGLDDGLSAGSQVTTLSSNYPIDVVSSEVRLTSADVVVETELFSLEDSNDVAWAAFKKDTGLTIQSEQEDALKFSSLGLNQRLATFTGAIEIPATGFGSLPTEFQSIGSTQLHEVLEAINNRIPLVYDRDGTVLNQLL